MDNNRDAQRLIRFLERGNYYIECPCCDASHPVKDVGLFYLNNFTAKAERVYEDYLHKIQDRKKELTDRKKSILSSSERVSQATNIGFLLERIAPSLEDFPLNRGDCRALFDPIDYLVFEGLSKKGSVTRLLFVEIKTGGGRLQENQRNIKDLVERKKIAFDTYTHKTSQ
jgi:predicted Holliday junction resolvase-like endonuclease